ncbi:hypothetical protein [Sphingobium sp. BS19]|nr:hypothetical protein [Sphingobium sp. BS19]|tara:strand:- start:567 stop:710 length:144 start_codon:yes stop_codon:yes gene_type:complete
MPAEDVSGSAIVEQSDERSPRIFPLLPRFACQVSADVAAVAAMTARG